MAAYNSPYRERHWTLAVVAVAVSAILHVVVLIFCGDWAISRATGMKNRMLEFLGIDRVPPMRVETMHADPMRFAKKVQGEMDAPSRGPIDASDQVDTLRQSTPPALTVPPSIPQEAMAPGVPVQTETVPEKIDATPWMPRQEIQEIYDRSVRDEVAALPRREIPAVERVDKAPDIVPAIELAGRKFGKDPEIPKAAESAEIYDTQISKGTFAMPVPTPPADAANLAAALTGEKFADKTGDKIGKVSEGTPAGTKEGSDTPAKTETEPKSDTPPEVPADPSERQARTAQREIAQLQENVGYVPIDNLLLVGMETFKDPDEPGKTYFRIGVQPNGKKPIPVIAKDIVFAQDVSGSMGRERMVFCRRALDSALKTLNAGDRFNIVAFRDAFEFCFPDWAAATADNLRKGSQFVAALQAHGNTDVFGSLKSIMQLPRDPRRPMIVFVVTDGKPTTGLVENAKIIGEFSALNNGMVSIYMYGTVGDANAYLMDMLTYCNRGGFTAFNGDRWGIPEDMAKQYDSIRNPIMSDITVVFDAASKAEVYPRNTTNLYKDRQLEICGVCPDTTEELVFQVRGLAAEKGYDSIFRINLARHGKAATAKVKSRWAQQKMYHLVGEFARTKEPGLLAEMQELNRKYGVAIPYEKEMK
ncbi:MAG: VWA domain-containing protein [Kiritimatiellae bacterium]|nr:VWA domain-containing protein [Kiritimatiellia bacterium]